MRTSRSLAPRPLTRSLSRYGSAASMLAAVAFATSGQVHAQTVATWDGSAGDFLWTNPANWTPEAVPLASNSITFGAPNAPTGTVILNGNQTAGQMQGVLTFTKSFTLGAYGTSNVLRLGEGVFGDVNSFNVVVEANQLATVNAILRDELIGEGFTTATSLGLKGGGTLYLTNPKNNLLTGSNIYVDGTGTTLMTNLGGLTPQVNGTGSAQLVGRQNAPTLGLSTAARTVNLQNGGEFKLIGAGANPDGTTVNFNLNGGAGAINITSAFQQMVLDDASQIGGFGDLVKNGKGRLTLASQDYNLGGNVTINAGILDLNRLETGSTTANTRFSSLAGIGNGATNTLTVNSGGAIMLNNGTAGNLDVATVIANDGSILGMQGQDHGFGMLTGGSKLQVNGTVNVLSRDLFGAQTQRFMRINSDLTGSGTLQLFGSTNAGGTPRIVIQRADTANSTFSGTFRLMENVSLELNPRANLPVDTGKLIANGDIEFAGWAGQLDLRDSDSAAANVKDYTGNDISVTTSQLGAVNRISVIRATTATGTGHQFNFGTLTLGNHRLAIEGNNGYMVGFANTASIKGNATIEMRTAPLVFNNAAALSEDAAGRTLTLVKNGGINTAAADVTSAGVISVSNLHISSGTLALRGANGSIGTGFGGAATTITINGGEIFNSGGVARGNPIQGVLNLDSNTGVLGVTAANNNDRIADSAVVNMRSNSILRLTSASNAQTTETIGTVNVHGHSLIDISKTGAAPAPVALTINSLNLAGTKPTVNFTGAGLGSTGTNSSRIILGNQATSSGFLGAQYHVNNEWAKYDVTVDNGVAIGVTPFTAADYTIGNAESAWDATQHNKQTAASVVLTANRSVNTLNLQPTATQNLNTAGFTLNVAGGGILSSGSTAAITGTSGAGALTSASGDLYVHNTNTLDIKVPVVNFLGADGVPGGGDDVSVNFIKSGTGTLRLTHQSLGVGTGAQAQAPYTDAPWTSTMTGSWIINDGTLDVHRGEFLGGRPIVLNGGTLQINQPVSTANANSILTGWGNNVTVNGNAVIGTDDNGESNDANVGANTIPILGSLTVNNGATLGFGTFSGDVAFMGGATFNGRATLNMGIGRGSSTNNALILGGAITGSGFDVVTHLATNQTLVIGGGVADTAPNTFNSPIVAIGANATIRLNKANGIDAIPNTAESEDLVINGSTVVWGAGHHGDLATTNNVNQTNNGLNGIAPTSPGAIRNAGMNQINDSATVTLLLGTLGEADRFNNEKWGTLNQKNGTLNVGLGTMEVDVVNVTGGAFNLSSGGTFKAGALNLQVGAYSPSITTGLPGDASKMSTLEIGAGGLNMTGQTITVAGGGNAAVAGAGAVLKLGGNVTVVDDPMLGNSGNQGIFIQIGNSFRELGNSYTDLLGASRTFTIDEDVQFYITTPIKNGGIVKDGGGALILQPHQASDFAGPIVVNNGVLAARADNAFGTGAGGVTINAGGTVKLEGGWTYADNFIVSGAGAAIPGSAVAGSGVAAPREVGALVSESGRNRIQGTVAIAGDATIASNGTMNPSATPAGGAFQFWQSEFILENAAGITGTGNLTLSGNGNGTITGGVNVSGGLTKDGAGRWVLPSAGTYAGPTVVSAGRLQISNSAALGATGSGTTVYAGATLELAGGITVNEPLTINDGGVDALSGALSNVGGNNTYSGGITLGTDATISSVAGNLAVTGNIGGANRNLTISGRGNGSVSGAIALGTGGLTKTGGGTWTLSGANTFTGATTLSGGNLVLDHTANNSSKISGTAPINFGGGNLQVLGSATADTTVNVGGITRSTGGGVIQVTNGTGRSATLNLGNITQLTDPITTLPISGGSLSFVLPQSGAITTTAPLVNGILGGYATVGNDWATKSGSNIAAFSAYVPLDLSGIAGQTDNARLTAPSRVTATAGLTANSLKIENGAHLALDTNILTLSSGGLIYNGTGNTTAYITGNDGFGGVVGTITGATPDDELFIHTGGGVLDVGAQLVGASGLGSVTKTGPGTLFLRNTGSGYTGSVNLNGGTLAINGLSGTHPTALGQHTNFRNINVNGGTFRVLGGYDLNLNGGQQMQFVIGPNGATFETQFGGDTGTALILNDANQLSGSGDILYRGGGRLTIGQASTGFTNYTGNVTIDGGVLSLFNANSVGGRADQTITLKAGSSLINQVGSGLGVDGLPNNLVLEGGASLFVAGGNRAYLGDVKLSGTNTIFLIERDNHAQQRDMHLMGRISGTGVTLNVVGGNNANPVYLSNNSNDFTGTINLGNSASLEARQTGSLGQTNGAVTVNLNGMHSRLLLRQWQNADFRANVVVNNVAEINSDRLVNYAGGSGQLLSLNNLTVNGGDYLQFGGGNSYVTHVKGAATFNTSPVLNVTGNVLFENGMNYTGASNSLEKRGGGSIILRGAANHTGTTLIQGGLVDLRGANGSLPNTSRVELRGGELRIENGDAVNTNRLNDAATVILGGGTLRISGNETFENNVSAVAGNTVIAFTPGNETVTSALTFNNFSRATGSTVQFQSAENGGAAVGATTLGNARTTPRIIIPGLANTAAGQVVPGFFGNNGLDFVKYDGTTVDDGKVLGVRDMRNAGNTSSPVYIENEAETGWTDTDIARTTAARTLTADRALQALKVEAAVTINVDAFKLRIENGGILAVGNAVTVSGGATGTLTAGPAAPAAGAPTAELFLAGNNTLTLSANVVDNGGQKVALVKTGTGTVVLSSPNSTYSGGVYVNSGTLTVNAGTGLGASSNTITLAGGTLNLSMGSADVDVDLPGFGQNITVTSNNSLIIADNGSLAGTDNNYKFGKLTIDGPYTLPIRGFDSQDVSFSSAALTGNPTIDLPQTSANSNTTTVSLGGEVSGTGFRISSSGNLANAAAALQIGNSLPGADDTIPNTYTGKIVMVNSFPGQQNQPLVQLNKAAGTTAVTGDVEINAGTLSWLQDNQMADTGKIELNFGTVDFNGRSETIAGVTMRGGAFRTNSAGTEPANVVTVTGDFNATGATNTTTADGIQVNSNSTLKINGILRLDEYSKGVLGASQAVLEVGGLEMKGTTLTQSSGAGENIVRLNGDVKTFGAEFTAGLGNSTDSDTFLELAGTRTFNVEDGQAPIDLSISSVVRNTAALEAGIIKTGPGTVQIQGGGTSNTYTGPTTINEGAVVLFKSANVNALGSGKVTVGDGNGGARADKLILRNSNQINDAADIHVAASGLLDLNSFNTSEQIHSLSGSGEIDLGPNSNLTVLGFIDSVFSGKIEGGGAITKGGTSTLELSGTNDYLGLTSVNEGNLLVKGSIGGINVAAGASLAPATGPGLLNVRGSFDLQTDATLKIELGGTTAGTGYDRINVTGGITLGGNLQGSLINGFTGTNDLFFIMINDGTDAVNNTFAGLAEGSFVNFSGTFFQITYQANFEALGGPQLTGGNDIALVIPEPASGVSLLAGLSALLGMKRLRRRQK